MATLQVIIDRAMYLSIEDRQFSPGIPGDLQKAALDTFVGILDENRYNVPFHQVLKTTLLSELENTKFTSILEVQYVLGTVVYDLIKKTLIEFNRESIVIGLKSIPAIYYFDNLSQTVKVYPEPNTGFEFIVSGYKSLDGLNLTDTIPTNMPRFMRSFLEYELANRLCNEYGVIWSDQKEKTRLKLERMLIDSSDIDLTPPINIEMKPPSSGKGSFPSFYYLSGGR